MGNFNGLLCIKHQIPRKNLQYTNKVNKFPSMTKRIIKIMLYSDKTKASHEVFNILLTSLTRKLPTCFK